MNKIIFLISISFFSTSFSQSNLVEFKNDLDDSMYSIKEVIPAVNQKNNDISLFFMNSKQVHGYLLNDNLEVINKLSLEDKRRKYNTIIGYSIKDDLNYNLFLTNNKNNKFAAISFPFGGESSALNEFKFQSSNEKFVQTVTNNNIFYLITVISGTSKLNIYRFDGINLPKPYTIEFGKNQFIGRDDLAENLYNLFKIKSDGNFISVETNKVDKDTPNSIEVVSKEKKLYVIDNQLVLTFDNNRNVTQIITIKLEDYSYEVKKIEKPLFDVKSSQKKSNTFIDANKFYSIASTDDDMVLQISNYKTGDLIKEIKLNAEDSIIFKNTPIIQEGGVYDNYRELESTKKFLRKITSGDIGVSSYYQNNKFLITIGSEKQVSRGGGGMMMPMGGFGGIPVASISSANMFFNPTFFAYNSYSSTKSVHIKCLFNEELKHISDELEENVFDRIKNFREEDESDKQVNSSNNKGYKRFQTSLTSTFDKSAETIFKYKNYFIVGSYVKKSKTYILNKFTD